MCPGLRQHSFMYVTVPEAVALPDWYSHPSGQARSRAPSSEPQPSGPHGHPQNSACILYTGSREDRRQEERAPQLTASPSVISCPLLGRP